MYIYPMQATQKAIDDHIKDPESITKLLMVETMLAELLGRVRKEVIKHGLSRGIQQENKRD